jgi:hypothetical protein
MGTRLGGGLNPIRTGLIIIGFAGIDIFEKNVEKNPHTGARLPDGELVGAANPVRS